MESSQQIIGVDPADAGCEAEIMAKDVENKNPSTEVDPNFDDPAVPIIAWKNLTVTSVPIVAKLADILKNNFKICDKKANIKGHQLLKNVSGQICGGFWAVMGESGCGN